MAGVLLTFITGATLRVRLFLLSVLETISSVAIPANHGKVRTRNLLFLL